MLSAAKVPLLFWAEAIATACFTQNRSIVIPRHEKTPYHITNERKPSVKFFHIFGSVCYIVRDGENLDKMKEKGDECIFMGYSTQSRAYRVFNKRTRVIMESIHVNFDELPQMASVQINSDLAPECQTMELEHDSLSPGQPLDEIDQVADDEFINIFSTPVQDQGETSSRHFGIVARISLLVQTGIRLNSLGDIGSDFCSAVECFFESGSFPKGSNSSFIALIPKVTDAKLVTDFRPISLIGCVYKVVTKILANRLATVISDLVSDIQSVFVANRQILDRATSDGLFKGIQIQGSMAISHIFYADDAVFTWKWSDFNLDNIVKILKCFFLALGLKINIQKSQVLGVGVPRNLINQEASLIGCAVMQNPFRLTLLKSVLGASPLYNMSIYKVPKGVLKEMEAIRCNFFNGIDPAERKITWVSWDKVLASKKNSGLGVSSFHALNRALLLKWWVWRFLSQDGSLWYRVIQALYGASFELHPVNQSSIWCSILHEMQVLISKGFDFVSHCKKRVGDGHNTRFRYDSWVFDQPLRVRSVRDGVERQQWDDLNSVSGSFTLSASKDRWIYDLNGDGVFRVKETIISSNSLSSTKECKNVKTICRGNLDPKDLIVFKKQKDQNLNQIDGAKKGKEKKDGRTICLSYPDDPRGLFTQQR
nr:hypothetical protein [Tanacetum cinerariifolium]